MKFFVETFQFAEEWKQMFESKISIYVLVSLDYKNTTENRNWFN